MTYVGVRFADCELSIERIELRRAGKIVDMEPQVFDVLAYLLRHRERVVPKTELLDQIWGNRFVTESALSSRIKSARRAVGDTGRDQRIIKTVYGRGYRFVADVNDHPAFRRSTDARVPITDPAAEGAGDSGGIEGTSAPAQRLLRAVGDIPAGAGAAIAISGGPKSGKTELLHQVAGTARRLGLAVGLSAPALASRSPYTFVAEALHETARTAPGLLGALPAGCRAELERAWEGQLPTARQRWFVTVREFLVAAAEHSGAVLLLDDLHLAYGEALILVEDMARLTRGHRLAVIIAQRSDAPARPNFELVELADADPAPVDEQARFDLPAELAEVLRQVAQLGDRFDRIGFTAAAGRDSQAADQLLEQALTSGAIRVESGGYRFASPSFAARLAAQVAPAQRPVV